MSRKQSYKKHQPKKVAWSNAYESPDEEDEPIAPDTARPDDEYSFSNLSFTDSQPDTPTGALIGKMQQGKKAANAALEHWRQHKTNILANREQLHEEIEQRKRQLLQEIEEHAVALHDELDEKVLPHKEESTKVVTQLQKCLHGADQLEEAVMRKSFSDQEVRQRLTHVTQQVKVSLPKQAPCWQPLRFSLMTSESPYLLSNLFGRISNAPTPRGMNRGLMDKAEHLKTFSAKSSKDNREMGLADVALLDGEKIIVVDKHNKLVKMFHGNGKLMRLIGKGILKDPCRVCVLRRTSNILISDLGHKCVKMFDPHGEFKGEFIRDMRYPSAICENMNEEILVIDFEQKKVAVYDDTGKNIYKIDIGLSCPAHISTGANGNVYISDWKGSTLKVFDVGGNTICSHKETGESGLNQPQGVHADSHGNVFVADKGNHRVQVFSADGKHLRSLAPSINIKLPIATTTSENGLLVVAEYTGAVKIFRYLDETSSSDEDECHTERSKTNASDDEKSLTAPDTISLDTQKLL